VPWKFMTSLCVTKREKGTKVRANHAKVQFHLFKGARCGIRTHMPKGTAV